MAKIARKLNMHSRSTHKEKNRTYMKIYNGINKENCAKYGKNKPYLCWEKKDVHADGWNADGSNICEGDPKILYDGRFCAVSGFIFAVVNGKYSVLANKRGEGTPDYQGFWNCPCGYLERFENSKEGIAREIYEECGYRIDLDKLRIKYVETEPEKCNNGNVTIRHIAFIGKEYQFDTFKVGEGGEDNEVDNVRWIPVDDIDCFEWAFNHYETIKKYMPKKWKRRLIEFIYKIF